jgi:hypothetical protein
MEEHLLRVHEVLGLISSTANKPNQNKPKQKTLKKQKRKK